MSNFIGPFPFSSSNGSCGPYPTNFESQWNDINMSVNTAKHPGTSNPTPAAFTTNTVLFTFAEGDYVDLETIELLHDWDEGTEISPHFHLITAAQDANTRTVQYTLYYTLSNTTGVATGELSATSGVYTIPANTPAKTHFLVELGAHIDMTGYKIGSQMNCRFTRDAITSGNGDPSANPYISSIGIHYKVNSLGSTEESTK